MTPVTDEMRAAVKRRMGLPDDHELDPWMEAAICDVVALVERDHHVHPRLPRHAPIRNNCPYCMTGLLGQCPWHSGGES